MSSTKIQQTDLKLQLKTDNKTIVPQVLRELIANQNLNLNTDAQDRQLRRKQLLLSLQENYYTFAKDAKNKKFGWLKSIIFKQLFKYVHRQIHFNDYVRNFSTLLNEEVDEQQFLIEQLRSHVQPFRVSTNLSVSPVSRIEDFASQLSTMNVKINAISEMISTLCLEGIPDVYRSKGKMIFYSQFKEDEWIVNNIELPAQGVFIDVGAADGITFSNTYYFEKQGWRGFCFEPSPEQYHIAKKIRKKVENLGISEKSGKGKFFINENSSDWSGFATEGESDNYSFDVTTVRLDEYCIKHDITTLDLLSIDTEGTELSVLRSLNFNTISPRIIIVEYLTRNSDNHASDIQKFFQNLPYSLVHQTEANMIWKYDG